MTGGNRLVYYGAMVNSSTRDALVHAGTRLLLRSGYQGTGVQDVLAEAKVPKGSFYHYFDTKEALGIEALRSYFADHESVLDRHLGDASRRPLQRLRDYFVALSRGLEENAWTTGCLVGTLSQELAGQSETFRQAIEEIHERWHVRVADCLREAQAAGDLRADANVDDLADFCLSSWQGALQHMKVQRSDAPLRRFEQVLFGSVLSA